MSGSSSTREGVVVWSADQYPHDPDGATGRCHFAPNCGGGMEYGRPDRETGERRRTRPDHPSCPDAPAEFSERTGMLHEGAGFERYVPLCRPRAERRYGRLALEEAERE